jgi:streptogramin lyase
MPIGIAPGSDGNVWFTEKYGNNIGRVTPAGIITEFPVPTAQSEPNDCALGSDGNIWFTEFVGNKIGRITPAGAITEFSVPNVGQPNHIALGPDGNVWFTETAANRMGRVTPAGAITEFSVDGPVNLTAGPGGDLWFTQIPVADSGGIGTTIVAKMTTTGSVTQFPSTVANSCPGPITTGSDGNLWFVEPLLYSIGRMPPTGGITEIRDLTQGISAFGITTGPDGNVWYSVGDMDCSLGRVTPSGQISEYRIPSPYAIVYRMCTGSDGNIWFAENGANKIGYIVPDLLGTRSFPPLFPPPRRNGLDVQVTPPLCCQLLGTTRYGLKRPSSHSHGGSRRRPPATASSGCCRVGASQGFSAAFSGRGLSLFGGSSSCGGVTTGFGGSRIVVTVRTFLAGYFDYLAADLVARAPVDSVGSPAKGEVSSRAFARGSPRAPTPCQNIRRIGRSRRVAHHVLRQVEGRSVYPNAADGPSHPIDVFAQRYPDVSTNISSASN